MISFICSEKLNCYRHETFCLPSIKLGQKEGWNFSDTKFPSMLVVLGPIGLQKPSWLSASVPVRIKAAGTPKDAESSCQNSPEPSLAARSGDSQFEECWWVRPRPRWVSSGSPRRGADWSSSTWDSQPPGLNAARSATVVV